MSKQYSDKSISSVNHTERGSAAIVSTLTLVAMIAAALAIVIYVFGDVVRPGYVGVRQITLGAGKGFSKKGLTPGYHWALPFYSRIHHVPQTLQVLHLLRNDKKYPKSEGALEVQTTNREQVDVDVSFVFRYYPTAGEVNGQKHGGPADLFENVGRTEPEWHNHIRRVAYDELRQALAMLSTDEFYKPELRERQVHLAQDGMNRRLSRVGVGVEAVLVRRYTYRDPRIDDEIFRRNLQDQEKRQNDEAVKLAKVKAELEQVAAGWDAKIRTLNVEGENTARVIRSEGELYEAEKIAEGDLLYAKATAEADRLKANALSASAGADVYVARELAPLLGSLKGGIVTDLDPFNLRDWINRFGIGN